MTVGITELPPEGMQLGGVALAGDAERGTKTTEGLSLLFTTAGITVQGPQPQIERLLVWSGLDSASCREKVVLPDGRNAAVMELTSGGQSIRFLFPTESVTPGQAAYLDQALPHWLARYKGAPARTGAPPRPERETGSNPPPPPPPPDDHRPAVAPGGAGRSRCRRGTEWWPAQPLPGEHRWQRRPRISPPRLGAAPPAPQAPPPPPPPSAYEAAPSFTPAPPGTTPPGPGTPAAGAGWAPPPDPVTDGSAWSGPPAGDAVMAPPPQKSSRWRKDKTPEAPSAPVSYQTSADPSQAPFAPPNDPVRLDQTTLPPPPPDAPGYPTAAGPAVWDHRSIRSPAMRCGRGSPAPRLRRRRSWPPRSRAGPSARRPGPTRPRRRHRPPPWRRWRRWERPDPMRPRWELLPYPESTRASGHRPNPCRPPPPSIRPSPPHPPASPAGPTGRRHPRSGRAGATAASWPCCSWPWWSWWPPSATSSYKRHQDSNTHRNHGRRGAGDDGGHGAGGVRQPPPERPARRLGPEHRCRATGPASGGPGGRTGPGQPDPGPVSGVHPVDGLGTVRRHGATGPVGHGHVALVPESRPIRPCRCTR